MSATIDQSTMAVRTLNPDEEAKLPALRRARFVATSALVVCIAILPSPSCGRDVDYGLVLLLPSLRLRPSSVWLTGMRSLSCSSGYYACRSRTRRSSRPIRTALLKFKLFY